MFQHSTAHMIIYWHIHMVHFLLLLHQNYSLLTGSLRRLYFLSSNCCNFYTIANIVTKFAAYVVQILLCESCKFGAKICYSNWDNGFFLRDCFLLVHPVQYRHSTVWLSQERPACFSVGKARVVRWMIRLIVSSASTGQPACYRSLLLYTIL